VGLARAEYARRRTALADALRARGVETPGHDGLTLWIPVADQQAALITLAARGIAASPGDRFRIGRGRPHIRAASSGVVDGVAELADALALAAGHG
jgi:DNA-binding transcriptional MocR family regulator